MLDICLFLLDLSIQVLAISHVTYMTIAPFNPRGLVTYIILLRVAKSRFLLFLYSIVCDSQNHPHSSRKSLNGI